MPLRCRLVVCVPQPLYLAELRMRRSSLPDDAPDLSQIAALNVALVEISQVWETPGHLESFLKLRSLRTRALVAETA
eukprot:2296887-Alexandrium_andersonii.AAC.1